MSCISGRCWAATGTPGVMPTAPRMIPPAATAKRERLMSQLLSREPQFAKQLAVAATLPVKKEPGECQLVAVTFPKAVPDDRFANAMHHAPAKSRPASL